MRQRVRAERRRTRTSACEGRATKRAPTPRQVRETRRADGERRATTQRAQVVRRRSPGRLKESLVSLLLLKAGKQTAQRPRRLKESLVSLLPCALARRTRCSNVSLLTLALETKHKAWGCSSSRSSSRSSTARHHARCGFASLCTRRLARCQRRHTILRPFWERRSSVNRDLIRRHLVTSNYKHIMDVHIIIIFNFLKMHIKNLRIFNIKNRLIN
jgi:hypothetical protein